MVSCINCGHSPFRTSLKSRLPRVALRREMAVACEVEQEGCKLMRVGSFHFWHNLPWTGDTETRKQVEGDSSSLPALPEFASHMVER